MLTVIHILCTLISLSLCCSDVICVTMSLSVFVFIFVLSVLVLMMRTMKTMMSLIVMMKSGCRR